MNTSPENTFRENIANNQSTETPMSACELTFNPAADNSLFMVSHEPKLKKQVGSVSPVTSFNSSSISNHPDLTSPGLSSVVSEQESGIPVSPFNLITDTKSGDESYADTDTESVDEDQENPDPEEIFHMDLDLSETNNQAETGRKPILNSFQAAANSKSNLLDIMYGVNDNCSKSQNHGPKALVTADVANSSAVFTNNQRRYTFFDICM